MKTLSALFVLIALIGCTKNNPVDSSSSLSTPSVDITVSVTGVFLESHTTTQPTDTLIHIFNPSTSKDTLTGYITFADSSLNIGSLRVLLMQDSSDAKFKIAPNSSLPYFVRFTPHFKNVPYKAAFKIFHNVPNKPNPIVIPINAYCS